MYIYGDTVALAIAREGGVLIQKESDDYVTENGPLDVGEVITASPGNLRCLRLFHSVPHHDGK